MSDVTICKTCFCCGRGMIPINGEFVCEDCLSLTETRDEVIRLNQRLAAAEADLDVKNLTIKNLSEVVEDRGLSIGCMSRQLTECKQKLATAERVLECGHVARFTTTHFGGEKHGESYCTLCELGTLTSRLAAAEAEREQYRMLAVSYGKTLRLSEASVDSIVTARLAQKRAAKGGRDGAK